MPSRKTGLRILSGAFLLSLYGWALWQWRWTNMPQYEGKYVQSWQWYVGGMALAILLLLALIIVILFIFFVCMLLYSIARFALTGEWKFLEDKT